MFISEEEKEEIRKKYEDNISKEVLTHLKRHYPVTQHDWTIDVKSVKLIDIDGKQYFMDGNKKFLVNKLSSVIQDEFPDVEKSILRRTVKYYLDVLK